ncbi:hypothetical protein CCC_00808 [Paramagnetospirillum magnetotacticum MS-1]|uniref:Aminoglycoside phosphotransferase domain-containing protein n=1 Tax=Paramagnetospirillum magnetotacticum MS-1 TaxID=272627 RepID=A0A0C2U8B9_PARME|nr:phosphotransferase [Paramagnetospirillum magnetotacticum]KIL97747.1 hypothetical protein CCC_00808 [Paramagnetospirillum magnetotacticum MS-1]
MAETCSSAWAELAARLARIPVRSVTPGGRGGNNRLYRVECEDGAVFALKSYPRTPNDTRDRLGAEFAALAFLARHGVAEVPAALAHEGDHALYQWIEGEAVADPTPADLDAAIAFAARLHGLRHAEGAESLAWASEACTSGSEMLRQVDQRLARLRQVAADHDGLAEVLDAIAAAIEACRARAAAIGELAKDQRTLSPADFGFHNALRMAGGGLVFIDFEYFGWDDPVKLAAEFDLHPGMSLSPPLSTHWREGIKAVYEDVPGFAARWTALRPLLAARWALIVLNEFLPERWARRAAAGETDAGAARLRQLDKARILLGKVSE